MIEMKYNDAGFKQAMKILSGMPGKIQSVKKHALTEGGKVLRTAMKRALTEKYYVKSSDVIRGLGIKSDADSVMLTVRGQRRTLQSFMMRPRTAPSKRKPAGYLEGGIERGKNIRFKRGFVMNLHNLPVRRTGKGKHGSFEGLHVIIGPAIAQLAQREEILPEVKEKVNARISQQIKYWTLKEAGLLK